MLPKAKRLTIQDFRGVRPKLIYRGVHFDVSVAPSEITKFSCIIAKKRIKRAVDRNRARRKVYALLKDIHPSTPQLFFIYPTKAILEAPHPLLKEEIEKAFATL